MASRTISLRIPDELLAALDEHCRKKATNRNRVVAELLVQMLGPRKFKDVVRRPGRQGKPHFCARRVVR